MQPRQLTACPPPASYVYARPAKLRPPWRSVQAVTRSRGGEPNDVQTSDKAQSESINQPELSSQPPTLAGTLNPAAVPSPSTSPSPSSNLLPSKLSTTTEGVSLELIEELPNIPRPDAAVLVGNVEFAATGGEAKANTVAVGKTVARENAVHSSPSSLSGVALSVLVMAELMHMLSGNGQQVTPEELRRALANFDITAQDLRQAEAAGVLSPELLRSLGLQPTLSAPTPSSPALPRKPAEDSSAKAASQSPQQKATQLGLQGRALSSSSEVVSGLLGIRRIQPPPPDWPPTPSQDPAIQVLNAVTGAAEVAVVASGAAVSQFRTIFSDVLYGVFNCPFGNPSAVQSADKDMGGGSDGAGGSGSGGGNRNSGGDGNDGNEDAGGGGNGSAMHPHLYRFLQLLAAVSLLLPPDRQLLIMRQLRDTLGYTPRYASLNRDTRESPHTLWLRHPANHHGQRLSSNLSPHSVWRPFDAWHALQSASGLPRAAQTAWPRPTQGAAPMFVMSVDAGLRAGAAHDMFDVQVTPLVGRHDALSIRGPSPSGGMLHQPPVADETNQEQPCEGRQRETLRLGDIDMWDVAAGVTASERYEVRLLPAVRPEGPPWFGSSMRNRMAGSCIHMARLTDSRRDSPVSAAAEMPTSTMVQTTLSQPAPPETQLDRTGFGQHIIHETARIEQRAYLQLPAPEGQSASPAARSVLAASHGGYNDMPPGVPHPIQHDDQYSPAESSASSSQAAQSAGHDMTRSQASSRSWSPREVATSSTPSTAVWAVDISSSQTSSPLRPALAAEVSRLTFILDSRRSTLEHTELAEAGHGILAPVFPTELQETYSFQLPALAAESVADVAIPSGSDDWVQTDSRSPLTALQESALPGPEGPMVVPDAPWAAVKASAESPPAMRPRSDTMRDQVHPRDMSCGGVGPADATQGAGGSLGLAGIQCHSNYLDHQGAVDTMGEQGYELDITALYRRSVSAGGAPLVVPWGMEGVRTWPAMPVTPEEDLATGDSGASAAPAAAGSGDGNAMVMAGDRRLNDAVVESVEHQDTKSSVPVDCHTLQGNAYPSTAAADSVLSVTSQLPEAVSLTAGIETPDVPAESFPGQAVKPEAGLPVLQDAMSDHRQGPAVSLRPLRPPQNAAAEAQCPMLSARQPSHLLRVQRASSWNTKGVARSGFKDTCDTATKELPRTQSYDFGRELRAPLGLGGGALLSRRMPRSSSCFSLKPSGRLRPSSDSEEVPALAVSPATPHRRPRSPTSLPQHNLVEVLSQLSPIESTSELDAFLASPAAATRRGGSHGWSQARAAVAATLVAVPALAATAWIARSSTHATADVLASLSSATATALVSQRAGLSGYGAGSSTPVANSSVGRSMAVAVTLVAYVIAVPLLAAAYFLPSSASPSTIRLWTHLSPARSIGAVAPSTSGVVISDSSSKDGGLGTDAAACASPLPPQSPRAPTLQRVHTAMSHALATAVAVSGATSEAAWRRLRSTTECVRRGLWSEGGATMYGRRAPSEAAASSSLEASQVSVGARWSFGGIRTELFPQPASPAANPQGSELSSSSAAHSDKQQEQPVHDIASTSGHGHMAPATDRRASGEIWTGSLQQDTSSLASPLATPIIAADEALQPNRVMAASLARQAAAVASSRRGPVCNDAMLQAEDSQLAAYVLPSVGINWPQNQQQFNTTNIEPPQFIPTASLPSGLKHDRGSVGGCSDASDGEGHSPRLGSERSATTVDSPVVAVQANAAHGGSGLALVLLHPHVQDGGQQLLVGRPRHLDASSSAVGLPDALTHLAYHRLHAQRSVVEETDGTDAGSFAHAPNPNAVSPTECTGTGEVVAASDAEVGDRLAVPMRANISAASTPQCDELAILSTPTASATELATRHERVSRPPSRVLPFLKSLTDCGSGGEVSSSGRQIAGSHMAHGYTVPVSQVTCEASAAGHNRRCAVVKGPQDASATGRRGKAEGAVGDGLSACDGVCIRAADGNHMDVHVEVATATSAGSPLATTADFLLAKPSSTTNGPAVEDADDEVDRRASTLEASAVVESAVPKALQPTVMEAVAVCQAARNLAPEGPRDDVSLAGHADAIRDADKEAQSCTTASVDAAAGVLADRDAQWAAALTPALDHCVAVPTDDRESLDDNQPAAASEEGATGTGKSNAYIADGAWQGEEKQHAACRVEDAVCYDIALLQPAVTVATVVPADVGRSEIMTAVSKSSTGAIESGAATLDAGLVAAGIVHSKTSREAMSSENLLRKGSCEAAAGGEVQELSLALARTCVHIGAQRLVPELSSTVMAITADDTRHPEPIHSSSTDRTVLSLDEGTSTRALAGDDPDSAAFMAGLGVVVARTQQAGQGMVLQPPAAACSTQAASPSPPEHVVAAGTDYASQVTAGTDLPTSRENIADHEPITTEALSDGAGGSIPTAARVLARDTPTEDESCELAVPSQELALTQNCLVDAAGVGRIAPATVRDGPCVPSPLGEEDAQEVPVAAHALVAASITPVEVSSRPPARMIASPPSGMQLACAQELLDTPVEAADTADAGVCVEGDIDPAVLPSVHTATTQRELYLAAATTVSQELEQDPCVELAAEGSLRDAKGAATEPLMHPIDSIITSCIDNSQHATVSKAEEHVQDEVATGGAAEGNGQQATAEAAAEPVGSIPPQNVTTATVMAAFHKSPTAATNIEALGDGQDAASSPTGATAAAAIQAPGGEAVDDPGDVDSSFSPSQAAGDDVSVCGRSSQPEQPWWQGAGDSQSGSTDDQSMPSLQSLPSLRMGSRSEVLLLLSPNGSMEQSQPVSLAPHRSGSSGGSNDSGSVTILQMVPEPGVGERDVEARNEPVVLVALSGEHIVTADSEQEQLPHEQSPAESDAAATPLADQVVAPARQDAAATQPAPEVDAMKTYTPSSRSALFSTVAIAVTTTSAITPSKIPKPPSARSLPETLIGSRSSLPHPPPVLSTASPARAHHTSTTTSASGLKRPPRPTSALCDAMDVPSPSKHAATWGITSPGPSTSNGAVQTVRSRRSSCLGLASSSACESPARVAFGRAVVAAQHSSRAGPTRPPSDSGLPYRGGVRTASTTPVRGSTAPSGVGITSMAAKALAGAFEQQATRAAPRQSSSSLPASRAVSSKELTGVVTRAVAAQPGRTSISRPLNRGVPSEKLRITGGPKEPAAAARVPACAASSEVPIPIGQATVAEARSPVNQYDSGSGEDGFGSPHLPPPPLDDVSSSRPSPALGPADDSTAYQGGAIHSCVTQEGSVASGGTANWLGVRNGTSSCGSSRANSGRLASMELGGSATDLMAAVAALRPSTAFAAVSRPSQPMQSVDSPSVSVRSAARPGVSYRPAAHFAPSSLAVSAGDAKPMSPHTGIAGSPSSRGGGSGAVVRRNAQGLVARVAAALERKSADDPRLRCPSEASSGAAMGKGSPLSPNGRAPRSRSERLSKLLLTFDAAPLAPAPSPLRNGSGLARHSAPLSPLSQRLLHACSAPHEFVRRAPAPNLILVGSQREETGDAGSGRLESMQSLQATSIISPPQRPQLPELDTPKSEMAALQSRAVGLKETQPPVKDTRDSATRARETEDVIGANGGDEASDQVVPGSGSQPAMDMPQLAAAGNLVEGVEEGGDGRAEAVDAVNVASCDGQDGAVSTHPAPADSSVDDGQRQVLAMQQQADAADADKNNDGDHTDDDVDDEDDRLDPAEEAALAAIVAAAAARSSRGVSGGPPERLLAAISSTLQAAADSHVSAESTASQDPRASANGPSALPVLQGSATEPCSVISSTSTAKKAAKLTSKWKRAFKSLLKGSKSKSGGAPSVDAASSVGYSARASSLPGASDIMSALDGLAGLDGFSVAGTSVTDTTLASAATAPAGDAAARKKRKTLWKRLKRKLGKLVGAIPRSWEVQAQQLAAAAAAQAAGELSVAASERANATDELGDGVRGDKPASA